MATNHLYQVDSQLIAIWLRPSPEFSLPVVAIRHMVGAYSCGFYAGNPFFLEMVPPIRKADKSGYCMNFFLFIFALIAVESYRHNQPHPAIGRVDGPQNISARKARQRTRAEDCLTLNTHQRYAPFCEAFRR
jgi:hypothetical protein